MRDVHLVEGGKRRYYDDLEQTIVDVAKKYPTATRQGSVGAWSWTVKVDGVEEFVAEAWIHPTKPGWWVRIK